MRVPVPSSATLLSCERFRCPFATLNAINTRALAKKKIDGLLNGEIYLRSIVDKLRLQINVDVYSKKYLKLVSEKYQQIKIFKMRRLYLECLNAHKLFSSPDHVYKCAILRNRYVWKFLICRYFSIIELQRSGAQNRI